MSEELAVIQQDEAALAARVADNFGNEDDLVVPRLKVTQDRTNEVKSGDAQAGEIINSLSGESYGNVIEFVVAGFEKRRFRTDEKTGDVICNGREGACGCHAVAYDECPDSEEQYAAAVNRGEKEWGKGPPCATTYNFAGFIPGSEMPVELSLMRGSAKVAKKLLTLLRFQRAPWDRVIQVAVVEASNKRNEDYYSVTVKQSRVPTDEERQQAVTLAGLLQSKNVVPAGASDEEEAEKPPAEKPEGEIAY